MKYPEWVLRRVLDFLNAARSAEQILAAPELKDDPDSGSSSGYVIGEKVAKNIIEHRRRLPRRRYQSRADILAVAGLGEDKLNDLLHSFNTSADETFRNQLFDGILLDNWELHPLEQTFDSLADLRLTADGLDRFRLAVAQMMADREEPGYRPRRHFFGNWRTAYVASYPEAHLGSFAFASWWYRFDQDNWFSYEKIRLACECYLGHYGHGADGLEFRLLQLYNESPNNEITRSEMIPVVVNYAEAKITVWDAQLND